MIHVAVLMRQYVDAVLAGTKTVECRLTRDNRAPFELIEPGERIYFKQSAGPYRATALAEHVLCESGLTPRRVREIRRDYNDLIGGEGSFWRMKSASRFCTLIWLKEVEPTDCGPAVRPLQGVAWLALDKEPAWRRGGAGEPAFAVEITDGNLRNGTLYVTRVLDRFPPETIGGTTRRQAGAPMTLMLHGGPTVQTDIVGPRKLIRCRVWRTWFRSHGAAAGDRVLFTPIDDWTYCVGLLHDKSAGRR